MRKYLTLILVLFTPFALSDPITQGQVDTLLTECATDPNTTTNEDVIQSCAIVDQQSRIKRLELLVATFHDVDPVAITVTFTDDSSVVQNLNYYEIDFVELFGSSGTYWPRVNMVNGTKHKVGPGTTYSDPAIEEAWFTILKAMNPSLANETSSTCTLSDLYNNDGAFLAFPRQISTIDNVTPSTQCTDLFSTSPARFNNEIRPVWQFDGDISGWLVNLSGVTATSWPLITGPTINQSTMMLKLNEALNESRFTFGF